MSKKKKTKLAELELQQFQLNMVEKPINWHDELKPRFQKIIENPNLADIAPFHQTMIKIGDATSRHQDCPYCKKYQTYLENMAGTFEYGGRMHDNDPEIKKIVSMGDEHLSTLFHHFRREHNYVNPIKHRFMALLIIIGLFSVLYFMFTFIGFICVAALSIYIYRVCRNRDEDNVKNGLVWIWH